MRVQTIVVFPHCSSSYPPPHLFVNIFGSFFFFSSFLFACWVASEHMQNSIQIPNTATEYIISWTFSSSSFFRLVCLLKSNKITFHFFFFFFFLFLCSNRSIFFFFLSLLKHIHASTAYLKAKMTSDKCVERSSPSVCWSDRLFCVCVCVFFFWFFILFARHLTVSSCIYNFSPFFIFGGLH